MSVHLGLDVGLDLVDIVQPLDLSLIVEAAAVADDVLGDGVVDGGDLELVCVELDVGLDLAVIVQPLVLSLVVEVAGGADDRVVDIDGGERGEEGGLAVEQVLIELLQPGVVDEIVLREFHVGREAGAVVEVVKLGFSGGDLEEIISLCSILPITSVSSIFSFSFLNFSFLIPFSETSSFPVWTLKKSRLLPVPRWASSHIPRDAPQFAPGGTSP